VNGSTQKRLAGKVAVVTGSSRGIGKAIARALAAEGATMAVHYCRGREQADELAAEFERNGNRVAVFQADVARPEDCHKLIEKAARQLGPVDILVNNAGVNRDRSIRKMSAAEWDEVIHTNLDSVFHCTKAALEPMIGRGWGRIINIASLQSVRAFANGAPYGATKGGVMQLTRAQAEAWSRHGVNANAIAPGFFPTGLTAPVVNDQQKWQANADKTFIGRNGRLEDLHGTAIYLASRASDYVTGQTIFVDGGFSAG
jgi:NAD(P)-dependent dehydrogenase (short-subunit alcohol dehydrogenase family)